MTTNISCHTPRQRFLYPTRDPPAKDVLIQSTVILPLIWITFKFQFAQSVCFGYISGFFFSKLLTKYRESFLTVNCIERCMSGAHPGSHEPFGNPHMLAYQSYMPLKSFRNFIKRVRNRNLSRQLKTLVIVFTDSALVSGSSVGCQKIKILFSNIEKLK